VPWPTAARRAAVAGPVVEQGRAVGAPADALRKVLPLGDRAQPLVQEDEPGPILAALEGLAEQPVVRSEIDKGHGTGPDGGDRDRDTAVRWRPAPRRRLGSPPIWGTNGNEGKKQPRTGVGPDRGRKKGADWRMLCGTARRRCGQAAGLRSVTGRGSRSAPPARFRVRAGWSGQKKSRAKGPARVDQVGMSGCSVFAPTGHCGQTSQTGAEEEHGGGLGDGGAVPSYC